MLNLRFLIPLLLFFPLEATGQTPFEIRPQGQYLLVFEQTPFSLHADAGSDLYFWDVPSDLRIKKMLNTLTVEKAPPGTYTVTVTAISADWDLKKFVQNDASITFRVEGGTPIPVPIPPTPIPPSDDKYGFTNRATQWAQNLQGKSIVADNFEAVSAAISAGAIRTVNDSQSELGKKNRTTITVDIPGWSIFFQQWQEYATTLNQSGKLRNVADDYAEAYLETAKGLRQ